LVRAGLVYAPVGGTAQYMNTSGTIYYNSGASTSINIDCPLGVTTLDTSNLRKITVSITIAPSESADTFYWIVTNTAGVTWQAVTFSFN